MLVFQNFNVHRRIYDSYTIISLNVLLLFNNKRKEHIYHKTSRIIGCSYQISCQSPGIPYLSGDCIVQCRFRALFCRKLSQCFEGSCTQGIHKYSFFNYMLSLVTLKHGCKCWSPNPILPRVYLHWKWGKGEFEHTSFYSRWDLDLTQLVSLCKQSKSYKKEKVAWSRGLKLESTSQGLPSLTISQDVLGRDKTIPSTNLPGSTWVYQCLDFTLPASVTIRKKKAFQLF